MTWSASWRLSVGTLTVFPVPPPAAVDRAVAGRAMLLAPLAVLPLALMAAALGRLVGLTGWPQLLSGLVVVAALALGTRALHLDGLADTVDGLGSGRDRERALEIMRRGDVGPMGVIALGLVLGTQVVCASTLTGHWSDAGVLAMAIAASRAALWAGCRTGVAAARPGGLGATVAASVPSGVAVVAGALVAGLVVAGVVLAGRPWWTGVLAVGLTAAVAFGTVAVAVRRFGGITGDVLGTTVELALTALLLGITVG